MEENNHENGFDPANDTPVRRKEIITESGVTLFVFIQFALLLVTAILMLQEGSYRWTLFLSIPFSIGLTVGVYTVHFKSRRLVRGLAILVAILIGGGLVLVSAGLEGAICIVMAGGIIGIPALAGLGAGYLIRDANKAFKALSLASIFLINSGAYVYDRNDSSEVVSVAIESVTVKASKEKIWSVLTGDVSFTGNRNIFLRAGVSHPLSMQIQDNADGCFLVCETNNGMANLKISTLDTFRLMRFALPDSVAPMRELSFYNHVDAAHLHGYFIPDYGEFEIQPVTDGVCVLIARTSYSYKITPVFYWRWWSDYLINAMHRQVLSDVRKLAER